MTSFISELKVRLKELKKCFWDIDGDDGLNKYEPIFISGIIVGFFIGFFIFIIT